VDFVIVLVVLAAVAVFVARPLRHLAGLSDSEPAAAGNPDERDRASQLAELEAAREAKYREIRDAELDHRTGKLSDADYEAIDSALRAEAIEILRALDQAAEKSPAARTTPISAP
jgi:hypothetical protein